MAYFDIAGAAVSHLPKATSALQDKALHANIAAVEKQTEQADAILAMQQLEAETKAKAERRQQAAADAEAAELEREMSLKAAIAGMQAYESTIAGGGDDVAAKQAGYDASVSVADEYIPGLREEAVAEMEKLGHTAESFSYARVKALATDPETYFNIQEKLATDKPSLQNFGDAQGNISETHVVGSDGYYEAIDRGLNAIGPVSQVERTADVTGELSGAGDDKTLARQAREVMGATDNLIAALDRVETLIDEAPQAGLGLPGDVSEWVDRSINALQGFAEIAGGWAEIDGKEVDESALLDVRLYTDIFEEASITDARIQANAIGIAYALARSANPDGRISDADLRVQLNRLQLNQSSKARMKASIGEVRREALSSGMNWVRASGATKTVDGREAFSKFAKALEKLDSAEDGGFGLDIGHEEGGYRYTGGNPADKANWEKI